MSNKQLLKKRGLSHWDRRDSMNLEENCGVQSCGVSEKLVKWRGVNKRKRSSFSFGKQQ